MLNGKCLYMNLLSVNFSNQSLFLGCGDQRQIFKFALLFSYSLVYRVKLVLLHRVIDLGKRHVNVHLSRLQNSCWSMSITREGSDKMFHYIYKPGLISRIQVYPHHTKPWLAQDSQRDTHGSMLFP